MRKAILLGAIFSVSSSFAVPLVNAEFSVGAMSHDPSGYVEYPTGSGTRADLKDTLGLGKKTKPFARAKIELPIIPNLYLQYIPMKFEGTGRYSTTLKFGNVTYNANVDLSTSVKLDHYDLGLYYNIPLVGTATAGVIDPELGINVRLLDFEGRITGQSGSVTRTETKSMKVPVPMGYAGLGINLPYVSLIGELRGIAYKGSRYYDVTGEVRIKPISIPGMASLFVGAGYRYEELKLDDVSDVTAKVKVKSLFANVGVAF